VRSTGACLTSVISPVIVAFCTIVAAPCAAQTRVNSLEELRRELAPGDFITVVPAVGPPVAGRLTRLGQDGIDVRQVAKRPPPDSGPRDVTVPLDSLLSLERPRDSSRNGAAIGAGIGAGVGGAMFVHALIIDRNEIDEWATAYVGAAAICTGIGALVGWAIDAANSKPHIRFDAASGRTKVSVRPAFSRGRGIALAVSFSR
jgi:hypothetical protein